MPTAHLPEHSVQKLIEFEDGKESQRERLRRVLSMADGKLKTADAFTFNEAARKRAEALARKETHVRP